MSNLLTQAYRRPRNPVEDNFLVTLSKDFDLISSLQKAGISSTVDTSSFLRAHPNGKARLWAVSTSEAGKRAWSKISAEDLVIFYGNAEIYAYGTIASKVYWPNNDAIWPSGKNWDFIYSLTDFHEINEGERPLYQELRRLTDKLDVQSVGVRSFIDMGVSKAELLEFLLRDAERSDRTTKISAISEPIRNIKEAPPILGERFKDRSEIWRNFGGQFQQGIVRFPEDSFLNVFSDEDGPYPDFQDPITGVIEYRGQGLKGEQKLTFGNRLLEESRLSKHPIRFWFKPSGGNWSFEKWVIANDRETIIESDVDGKSASRILWYLVPVPTFDPRTWPRDLKDEPVRHIPSLEPEEPKQGALDFKSRYLDLSQQIMKSPAETTTLLSPRSVYKRNRKIRRLILERAHDKCEFDGCTGMPPDKKMNGESILEVDHIDGLADGGTDHPSNMIALCPNCHEAKTHGVNKTKMMRRLKAIVEERESRLGQD